jgi:hypothetical protein
VWAVKADHEQILNTLKIFHQPGTVVEIRIPKTDKYKTISGYFDNDEVFADEVAKLTDEEFPGYYFTINPVNPALLARANNKPKRYAHTTTSDCDVIRLDWPTYRC